MLGFSRIACWRARGGAQSAMEFLLTYGWAILIVAVVLAALFELGVFNGLGGAQACIAQAGFICKNPIYTASSITFTFGQTNGRDYYGNWVFVAAQGEALNSSGIPVNLTCTQTGCANAVTVGLPGPDGVRALVPGQTVTVVFPANVFPAGAVPSNPPIGTQFAGYVWFGYCTAQPCPAPTSFSKVATLTVRSSASFLGPTTTSTTVTSTTSSSITSSSTTTTTTTTTTTSSSSSTTSTISTTTTTTTSSTSTTTICSVDDQTSGYDQSCNVVFTKNEGLSGDILTTGSITINGGVTLTTNGHSLIAGTTFINNGAIDTGNLNNGGPAPGGTGGSGNAGGSVPSSYAGSGASGGSGGTGCGCNGPSGAGGNTQAQGGSPVCACGGNGNPGATPTPPTLSSSIINSWYNSGIGSFLNAAGGGSSGPNAGPQGAGSGGGGAYGLYIQAEAITPGTINANGQSGATGDSGGGGGGGGAVLLAYQTSLGSTASISVLGGGGGGSDNCGCQYGGAGGNGQVLQYQWSSAPVTP